MPSHRAPVRTWPTSRRPRLRVAINRYLDKGPDFLKYGATSHFSEPSFIGFSPDAQKAMVEEAHNAGRLRKFIPLRRRVYDCRSWRASI